MKKYYVLSGDISRIEIICDDGSGPKEYFRNYVELEAKNKNEARRKAIKTKEFNDWVEYKRSNYECPLAGLEVEEIINK